VLEDLACGSAAQGATKAVAGTGVSAGKLGTVERAAGVLQVTYGGKASTCSSAIPPPDRYTANGVTDTWGTWSVYVTASPVRASAPPASGAAATSPTSPTASTSATPTLQRRPQTSPTSGAFTDSDDFSGRGQLCDRDNCADVYNLPVSTTSPTTTTSPKESTTTTTDPGSGGVAF